MRHRALVSIGSASFMIFRNGLTDVPYPRCRGLVIIALSAMVSILDCCTALALQVAGLQSPHSFLADPDSNSYFISNMNGDGQARDNNGFITKLSGNGEIIAFKFIQGGLGPVTLHAPKGMAIVGQVLYVADLEAVRTFDKTTGKPLDSIPIPDRKAARAGESVSVPAGIAADTQGRLYVTDQGADAIYRIDTAPTLKLSTFIADKDLAGPSGVAVHPKTGNILVVSWDSGKVFEITPEGAKSELVSNGFFTARFQNLGGVDFDRWGNMYVADTTKGKIWRMMPNKKFQVIAEYLPTPRGVGIDRQNHLILVPYQEANAAEVNGLESPVVSTGEKKKRTLADYGFVEPPKADKEGRPVR
jgi:DNA-binding beta-propeller fold protein YncE